MHYLIDFSVWVGAYSGQIQIVLALFALLLAVKGYKGLLKQLSDSDVQRIESLKYEIKNNILNSSAKISDIKVSFNQKISKIKAIRLELVPYEHYSEIKESLIYLDNVLNEEFSEEKSSNNLLLDRVSKINKSKKISMDQLVEILEMTIELQIQDAMQYERLINIQLAIDELQVVINEIKKNQNTITQVTPLIRLKKILKFSK